MREGFQRVHAEIDQLKLHRVPRPTQYGNPAPRTHQDPGTIGTRIFQRSGPGNRRWETIPHGRQGHAPTGQRQETTDRSRTHARQHPNANRRDPTTDGSRPPIAHPSSNPDFAALTKKLYQHTQISRHNQTWQSLPQSLSTKLDNIFNNIILPVPDEHLRGVLQELNDTTKSQLLIIAQTHLAKKQQEVSEGLAGLNQLDLDRAVDVTRRHLRNNFGRKIQPHDMNNWLAEATAYVRGNQIPDQGLNNHIPVVIGGRPDNPWLRSERRGNKRPALSPLSTQSTTTTSNRFELLAQETTGDDEDFPELTSTIQKRQRTSQTPTASRPEGSGTSRTTDDRQEGDSQEEEPDKEDERIMNDGSNEEDQSTTPNPAGAQDETPSHSAPTISQPEPSENQSDEVGEQIDLAVRSEPQKDNPTTVEPAIPQQPLNSPASPNDGVDHSGSKSTIPRRNGGIFALDSSEDEGESPSPTVTRRLSEPVPLTLNPPTVHDNEIKNNWALRRVRPDTTVLIIGDSNLRLLDKLPYNFEIHVFPGAYINHMTQIVKSLNTEDTKLQDIVVHAGINNKAWNFNSTQTDLNKLTVALSRARVRGHVMGINIPKGLSPNEKEVLSKINAHTSHRMMSNYISPLPNEQVSVSPTDKFKIHYDQCTVDKMCKIITKHFLSRPPCSQ